MSGNSGFVHFLYGTEMGRLLLKGILAMLTAWQWHSFAPACPGP